MNEVAETQEVMKRAYQKPVTEVTIVSFVRPLLEGSFIPIGGEGGFDVKEENSDWENIWNEEA